MKDLGDGIAPEESSTGASLAPRQKGDIMLALSARGARARRQGTGRRLEGTTAGSASGRRVLVVDDNRDSADSLAVLLEMLGYRVETAYDGRRGLKAAIESRPDVAVLDISMPGIDGYALARRLRARPGGEELRLIALTGWADERSRRLSREAGFDHLLVKPTAIEALVAAIGRAGGEGV
jgi:CheY-like chemotaxis protein